MMKKLTGFTLIELVIVIVILGILAVVAIPNFIDLSGSATTATLSGVAGALSSANAINYAARSGSSAYGIAVANCQDLSGALNGGLPTGYSISSLSVSVSSTAICELDFSSNSTNFIATGIN